MKFTILIFGCQMNYSDSARIKAVLKNCWLKYTDNIDEADIVIFDTCSVKQKAEDKITGKLIGIPKDKKIWITGCMIQHNFRNEKLKMKNEEFNLNFKRGNFLGNVLLDNPEIVGFKNEEMDKIDKRKDEKNQNKIFVNNAFNPMFNHLKKTYDNIELFFRIDDIWFLPLMMKEVGYKINYDRELINEYSKIIPEGIVNMNWNFSTAFVPISTWCNQFCSYCIVPYARWLEKCFSVEQIVNEVNLYISRWVQEIVLLWQIVNKHPEFIKILKEILKNPDLKRLRYTSPYPNYYSDELLKLHENETKLCPHIHIPLQSGSDDTLKKMFRWYTNDIAKWFLEKIQNLNRKISLTTDIIVWFPDETEEDFQKTLELVKFGNFDMIYIGIYSPRPWTYAEKKYPDNVPKNIKRDRRNKLNNLLKEISEKNNKFLIWKTVEVLINKIENWKLIWYTDDMKTILVKSKNQNIEKSKSLFWKFIKVKIDKAIPFKLYWTIV